MRLFTWCRARFVCLLEKPDVTLCWCPAAALVDFVSELKLGNVKLADASSRPERKLLAKPPEPRDNLMAELKLALQLKPLRSTKPNANGVGVSAGNDSNDNARQCMPIAIFMRHPIYGGCVRFPNISR